MRKALLYAPFDLRLEDVEMESPGSGQVLIKVRASSPYGTDYSFYEGTLRPAPYPIGFGGDFAGEIVQVGEGVGSVAVGDRVSASGTQHCEKCRYCRAGRENLCIGNRNPAGSFGQGFGEFAVMDANRVCKLPESVSWEAGAMVGSINLALLTFERLQPVAGDTVLQLGGGPMGWGSIQIGVRAGCTVIVTEPRPLRRELCRRFGADHVLDSDDPELDRRLTELLPEWGPDHVIESAGTETTHRQAMELAGVGGKVAIVAAKNYCLPAYATLLKELTIFGIRGVRHQKQALELIAAGEVDVTPGITHRFPFDELPEAFKLLETRPQDVGRIIVQYQE